MVRRTVSVVVERVVGMGGEWMVVVVSRETVSDQELQQVSSQSMLRNSRWTRDTRRQHYGCLLIPYSHI